MYNIIAHTQQGEELIDTAETYTEAVELLKEYNIAFKGQINLTISKI